MSAKARLREAMARKRDAVAPAERARLAQALTERLVALPEYREARTVLATMSIGSEWGTRGFIERALADGKSVALPRVAGPGPRRLRLHAVGDLARDLVPGVWDIPEPDPATCREVALAEIDFAWVPALAVDPRGFRLGYGAGYFDKLLTGRGPRPYCVAALPAAFVVAQVPDEPHDVAVDLVMSEGGPVSRSDP